jgi:hypothetical protein
MDARREWSVTLSEPLHAFLKAEAQRLALPVEYLVAGMILDTFGDEMPQVIPAERSAGPDRITTPSPPRRTCSVA